MVGVVGSSPIAPTKHTKNIQVTAKTKKPPRGGFFIVAKFDGAQSILRRRGIPIGGSKNELSGKPINPLGKRYRDGN
jgi:hypothetical protein